MSAHPAGLHLPGRPAKRCRMCAVEAAHAEALELNEQLSDLCRAPRTSAREIERKRREAEYLKEVR